MKTFALMMHPYFFWIPLSTYWLDWLNQEKNEKVISELRNYSDYNLDEGEEGMTEEERKAAKEEAKKYFDYEKAPSMFNLIEKDVFK